MRKLLLVLVGGLMFTSCATIISPQGEKNIPISVNGPEAYEVFVNGIPMGESQIITVHKDDIVTVKADGFQQSVTQVQGKFNGWVIGNLVFGGIIGLIVDGVTGNFNKVTTPAISVRLKELKN